mmetsp:Transcript_41684/g.107918  ORF Transcript_41684/g.107918 Transcript_41684/m.107918 type:complete len:217 (-) Transcript_41684:3293-3943(-)
MVPALGGPGDRRLAHLAELRENLLTLPWEVENVLREQPRSREVLQLQRAERRVAVQTPAVGSIYLAIRMPLHLIRAELAVAELHRMRLPECATLELAQEALVRDEADCRVVLHLPLVADLQVSQVLEEAVTSLAQHGLVLNGACAYPILGDVAPFVRTLHLLEVDRPEVAPLRHLRGRVPRVARQAGLPLAQVLPGVHTWVEGEDERCRLQRALQR